MKIMYFYQYFCTPRGSWGTRVYEFAKKFVEHGHEVTVVTSIYSKSDITAEKFVETQTFDGITVKVLNIGIDNKQSSLRRILSFINYCMLSSWYALTLEADVVIASSGPITVGLPGLIAKHARKRKMVFETRDLWPEGAIELGIIKNPVIKKLAYWFERRCYMSADHIVCLSPGMADNIRDRFGFEQIDTVTNSADLTLFGTPQNTNLPIFFNKRKVAIYTGNIGPVNNSYLLFRSAKRLKQLNRNDIVILLVGDGQQKEELIRNKNLESLDNFIVMDLIPKINLAPFIQHSLVSLVPLKGTPVLDTSSPNKLYESLAAGIPVIQNTKGWIRTLLEESGAGFTVDADDESELVEKLIFLADNPDIKETMGMKAKQLAQKVFDKNLLADKMLKILEKVYGQ